MKLNDTPNSAQFYSCVFICQKKKIPFFQRSNSVVHFKKKQRWYSRCGGGCLRASVFVMVMLCFALLFTAAGIFRVAVCCSVLQCVAVCCSVLQCVAVCCSVLQCDAVCCSVLQCVAVCCSVLQCVAVGVFCSCLHGCTVLQCVAVC